LEPPRSSTASSFRGYDVHQIGSDQKRFLKFAKSELFSLFQAALTSS